ncbi:MAG: GFA family protein [Pseudomonadales bacterium]|nr:GFA family protein [Pseudomonadales bacterium]
MALGVINIHKGSCQCGSVQYQFTNNPFDCCYCHCSVCQKLTGSAMGAYGSVHTQDFLWTQGEELLSLYQQKETTTRKFCSKCGSYLITTHSADPDNLFISLGALDSLIDSAPEFRQFVGSKAVWDKYENKLPEHNEGVDWR